MTNLKHYRDKAKGFCDLLNYAAIIAPGVILNKDGSLSGAFEYRAQDISSATATQRNSISLKMSQVFAKLGNGWAIHIDANRMPIAHYSNPLENSFKDKASLLIDEERRRFFENEGYLFESAYTMFFTYLPPSASASKFVDYMYEDNNMVKTGYADKTLKFFEQKLDEFENFATNVVNIKRLRPKKVNDKYGKSVTMCEMLSHINYAVIGEKHDVSLPSVGMYLDSFIGSYDFWGGVTPKIANKHIGIVSIDGFPMDATPNILDDLDKFGLEYRWNTRFIFMDRHEAINELEKYRRGWSQKVRDFKEVLFGVTTNKVNVHAQGMVGDIDMAIAEVNSGILTYGYYTSVLVIFDTNKQALEDNLKLIVRLIENIGFNARIETINAIEAYLGSLPGHVVQNVRRPLINTLNLSYLMPLSSIWAGDAYNQSPLFPPKSPALLYTVAGGDTPFRLNLHIDDVGHGVMFGSTGAGKSVLLALIAAQFRKYKNSKYFAFDKGKSLYALTMAIGGNFYDIGGEEGLISFAPLSNVQSYSEMVWAEDWIEICITLQGVVVTPEHRKAIHAAMLLQVENKAKSLTEFVTNLQNMELKQALAHYTLSGAMGHLLDGEEDTLKTGSFNVFEIESLMNLGNKNVIPVLLYLFYRIEKALDGSPALLSIDEAWIALVHEQFRNRIREWLKVFRKANCAVWLATQNLSDAAKSGMLDVLQELCPTKIFLPNPEAFNKGSDNAFGPYDLYKIFGLNDAQIQIIADGVKKKDYYYASPAGTRQFTIALGSVAKAFCASSSKEDIKFISSISNATGKGLAFALKWLDHKGVSLSEYEEFLVENEITL